MKKTLHTVIIAFAICLGFTSCKKSKKVAPVGALGPNFPYIINSVITPAILDSLKHHGAVINDGTTPPTINGIYLLSPDYCLFDNSGDERVGETFDDYKYKFSNQDNSQFSIRVDYEDIEGTDKGADVSSTYVSGNSSLFTIFSQTKGNDSGIDYTSLQVISGEIQSDGIKNLQLSDYLVSKSTDPDGVLEPAGSTRIFKDDDNLSINQTTFSASKKKVQSIGLTVKHLSLLSAIKHK